MALENRQVDRSLKCCMGRQTFQPACGAFHLPRKIIIILFLGGGLRWGQEITFFLRQTAVAYVLTGEKKHIKLWRANPHHPPTPTLTPQPTVSFTSLALIVGRGR